MTRPLRRVLVANRGEIALRIVRACRDAALSTVAVFADPDADAPHVAAADNAVPLGGSTAAETYLDVGKLVAAAQAGDADAVHPGYGFLSESAEFADAVIDAGLIWIGPPPAAIRTLGDKVAARAIAARVGAPLVAGSDGPLPDAAAAVDFARTHGVPIAIKAAYGGGGRGLRIARTLEEIPEMFDTARREAAAAFGRDECFAERFIEHARHIEAQVLADAHGEVRVVGTRDCSLQRRHQKLVEEAPAPFLTAGQRQRVVESAVAICRAAGYVSAGTVEFLLAPDGELSFLEVNTRLQVEHCVTEETTGLDLVREQLRIAAGEPLGPSALRSARTAGRGDFEGEVGRHAIEFRINAEDPALGFTPATGVITTFDAPAGPGVRLDAGVRPGMAITGNFDSLIAKLIVSGRDRREAIERARRALAEFHVDGLATTLPFHRDVVADPAFTAERAEDFGVHTRWIDRDYRPSAARAAARSAAPGNAEDTRIAVRVGGRWLEVDLPGLAGPGNSALGRARAAARERRLAREVAADGDITAPMQGTVVEVAIADGELVESGQLLMVIEAMKMQNPLTAPHPGRIENLRVAKGDTVTAGAALCRVTGHQPG